MSVLYAFADLFQDSAMARQGRAASLLSLRLCPFWIPLPVKDWVPKLINPQREKGRENRVRVDNSSVAISCGIYRIRWRGHWFLSNWDVGTKRYMSTKMYTTLWLLYCCWHKARVQLSSGCWISDIAAVETLGTACHSVRWSGLVHGRWWVWSSSWWFHSSAVTRWGLNEVRSWAMHATNANALITLNSSRIFAHRSILNSSRINNQGLERLTLPSRLQSLISGNEFTAPRLNPQQTNNKVHIHMYAGVGRPAAVLGGVDLGRECACPSALLSPNPINAQG